MKKQITIDGENSDWYEKAIFILKDKNDREVPDNLFLYAEDIIESYLKKNPSASITRCYSKKDEKSLKESAKEKAARGHKIDVFFNSVLVICSLSIIVVLVLMMI